MKKFEKVPLSFEEVKSIAFNHLIFDVWDRRIVSASRILDGKTESGHIELDKFPLAGSTLEDTEWHMFWDTDNLFIWGIAKSNGQEMFKGKVFLSPDKDNVDDVLKCLGR